MITKNFQTRESCAKALANGIADALKSALAQKGRASLALSGGNSPKQVLPILASASLPWSCIDVTLTDERCVPPSHIDSNAVMVRAHFLEQGADTALFHPLWEKDVDIDAGLKSATATLQAFPWPLDVVYLGMGDDGHFASLFPSDDVLKFEGSDSPVVGGWAPSSPHQRISLSLSTILKSRQIFLHVTGNGKRETFERARQSPPDPGCPMSLLTNDDTIDLHVYSVD